MSAKSLKFIELDNIDSKKKSVQVQQKEDIKPVAKQVLKPVLNVERITIENVSPTWTTDDYDSVKWGDAQGNPARGRTQYMYFENIPAKWRSYVKQWFCANEQIVERGHRSATSFGTALHAFTVWAHFLAQVDKLGVKTLSGISEEQMHLIFLNYSKSGVSEPTLRRYLSVLSRSYRWGPNCLRVLGDGLSFDPAIDPFLSGKARQAQSVGDTSSISEDVAHKLLSMAVNWIEKHSDDVLFVLKAAKVSYAAKDAKIQQGQGTRMLTIVQAKKTLNAHPDIAEGLRQLPAKLGFAPRSLILEGHQKLVAGAEGVVADFMKIGLLAKKMHHIHQGFVYIVCAGFNGWRSSEVFSVSTDGIKETPAGFALESQIIKTAANRKDPVSRPVPEIVIKAIKSLSLINAELEGLFPRKNGRQGEGLFRSTTGCDIDIKSVMEDIHYAWKFFQGSDIPLRSHQFRKFFAHFFIRRFQGGADAVRWHFRHVSKEMVWAYAKDAMNANHLVESKKELAKEIVNGIVHGRGYASVHVGADLKEVKQTLKLGARVLTVEEAATFISGQVEKSFADIHAMEWGYCLFQNGDKGAACEAKSGPIEARSEPSSCGRCKFLCTGKENVPFWQHTALLHQEIVSHPKVTKIMKTESDRILATAGNILARHSRDKDE